MRLSQAVLIALLAGTSAGGCLPARSNSDSSLSHPRLPDAAGPGSIRLDVAIIERPVGDRYLNHDLWDLADEQTVDMERKPALDDNGFRVGIIGGLLPADLMALLTSDRSCADPHRIQLRAGTSTELPLGGEQSHCCYVLRHGWREITEQLEHARCFLEVVPTPADNGRITLQFTPVLKYGVPLREARVVRDPSGEHHWDMDFKQATKAYPALGWEVTVSPDQYVVVGTRLDRDDSLGQNFFLDMESNTLRQRLLVIRTGHILPDQPSPESPSGVPPPLALQAGWRSARGTAPGEFASK